MSWNEPSSPDTVSVLFPFGAPKGTVKFDDVYIPSFAAASFPFPSSRMRTRGETGEGSRKTSRMPLTVPESVIRAEAYALSPSRTELPVI